MAAPSDDSGLLCLPVELISIICSYFPNSGIKSLRLACTKIKEIAQLRLTRVFLSANPINIRVFRAVADHDQFRSQITEIIYDDAHFPPFPEPDIYEMEEIMQMDDPEAGLIDDEEGCPHWFVKVCLENLTNMKYRKNFDLDRPGHILRARQANAQPPLRICWQYYQNIHMQQSDTMKLKRDEEAFIYGLKQFPSLKRVTITTATHGHLYEPLYETPMIRAFPYGLNYPIPRGWPGGRGEISYTPAESWEEMNEAEKEQWHGFRMITRVLAQEKSPSLLELVIDTNRLSGMGLNCTMFNSPSDNLGSPCDEYVNLATVLTNPGIRRLELPLVIGGQEYRGWAAFRSGYLYRMLSSATELEYFSFSTTVDNNAGGEYTMEHFIPLQSILPITSWHKLRHFHLSTLIVAQYDIMEALTILSANLQTISLNFLQFLKDQGNYRSLLSEIRDKMKWHERDFASRPRLSIGISPYGIVAPGRAIWVDQDIKEFLYNGGENPFKWDNLPNQVDYGTGIYKDDFDEDYERPNVSYTI
ncbi:hypothetical protein N7481_008856 [Penicillium waksmanii]|uniref:uncharacterized protein n=1 Tax=Penicillium waksmanii TaxID=69791 RepID=UPI002549451A|nr:uncharacterized protein N7481_008856 [Penicillium waksmanii]KAJ5975149.1 hypothetical protein N7481_008856 [Penicillium waksmanii]